VKVTNNIGLDLKAIKVDDYWAIVDLPETIKSGDIVISTEKDYNRQVVSEKMIESYKKTKHYFPVLASTKFIDKSIPVIKFVEQSVEDLKILPETIHLEFIEVFEAVTPYPSLQGSSYRLKTIVSID